MGVRISPGVPTRLAGGHAIRQHEVRFHVKIAEHDLAVKAKTALRFLARGEPVKVTVQLRGREVTHPEVATALLARFLTKVPDVTASAPALRERNLTTVLRPR